MKFDDGVELPDGSLLINGTTTQGFGAYSANRPSLLKLFPDGAVDMSYGTDGILRRDFPGGISCGFGTGFIALPDGKLLSTACRNGNANGGSPGLALFRYLSDGEPDANFASSGALHIDKAQFGVRAEAHAVGEILMVAYGRQFGANGEQMRIELNAFDSDGAYLTSFGTSGLVDDTTVFSGNSGPWGFSSLVDDQDRLVVFGVTEPFQNVNEFQLIRFLPDGTRDLSFGVNGRTLVERLGNPAGNPGIPARLMRLQNGNMVGIGHVSGAGGIGDTQWFQLDADGNLIMGTNTLLPAECHAYQISDVLELDNGRLLAQARSQSPAPIEQNQMRFSDPPVIMPHISLSAASLETTGTGPDFQWYMDGVLVNGATGTVFTPAMNGTYTVEMTDVFGCHVLSGPFELLNVGVRIFDGNADLSVIGPDANGLLAVRTDLTLQFDIMDARGARLKSGQLRPGAASIDVEDLQTGAYLLVLLAGQDRRVVRFAKL